MIILGIETSCDETAAAVVQDGTKILSSVVASSVELHKKTGGIIPEAAAREQVKCIIPVIETAIENCKLKIENLDGIAVTIGPGLIGSLLVGVETAKTLAYTFNKPIVPVNHLQAHLYANWLSQRWVTRDGGPQGRGPVLVSRRNGLGAVERQDPSQIAPEFPAIGLVVSGGHTDLVLMKGHGKIKWLGGTRDDAAGECFDKTARVLGLPYPGGPAIAKLAETGDPKAYDLPRPMQTSQNFDFSFSGLKTAVINLTREKKKINKANLAASIQEAIADCLVGKTIQAAQKYKVKSVLLAGGVAANQHLREKFFSSPLMTNYQLLIPKPLLCTDNAAYVAACAHFNFNPVPVKRIKANPSLEIQSAS